MEKDHFLRLFDLQNQIDDLITEEKYQLLIEPAEETLRIFNLPEIPEFVKQNGNAAHWAFTAIGHFKMSNERFDEARNALIKSVEVPTSPQLSSFGPTMSLAKRHLIKGDLEAVRQFLEKSIVIWAAGENRVKIWLAQLKTGQLPDLSESMLP